MTKRTAGSIIERKNASGDVTYTIRFRAYGRRRQYALGGKAEGVDRARAELELLKVLDEVRAGSWVPPEAITPPPEATCPTFGEFATEWLDGIRADGKAEKTIDNYAWSVEKYLVPYFGKMRLDRIDPQCIDRYRRGLIAEREDAGKGICNNSINATISRLRQILDEAVEHRHISSNPATGKKRRATPSKPRHTSLESAEQIAALVDAAELLDRKVTPGRDRALIATLVFAGLRISEALDLRWSDLDLSAGKIYVQGTKTEAADRTVNILPVLLDELKRYAAISRPQGDASIARLFPTSGARGRESASNVRNRVLRPAVDIANADLAQRDLRQIADITPHSLRRTFASLLVAIGESPVYVAGQLGHTDPKFTLGVYAKVMQDRGIDRDRLKSMVTGDYWAYLGANGPQHQLTALRAA